MGFESGGYAEKLGNRFEGKWVARSLLLLIHELLRSVTLESVGDDEAGVDLWVERLDGRRVAQQCKARNGTKSDWSFADLSRKGVLAYAIQQLGRSAAHEFELVSAVPATWLRDLSESARDSSGDPEHFFDQQIRAAGKQRHKAFTQLCAGLVLNPAEVDGRATAFDFLRRSRFHQFADDQSGRDELRCMARVSVAGEPDLVIAALCDFAVENLRKTLTTADVQQFLLQRGFLIRRLVADDRLAIRVDDLRHDFAESIKPRWAAGKMIPRPEAGAVISMLDAEHAPDAVIVHGAVGAGKTGVLYELTEGLSARGIPFIAVRLDRRPPSDNARKFGADLGLPESPVLCLEQLAAGGRSVLILDQLDALRWTRAHSVAGLDVCKELLREASVQRTFGRDISIVIACRTFDLEHDPEIRQWLKPSNEHRVEKVEVKKLPHETVREVVRRCGMDANQLTARRLSLLTSIQNLAMWADLVLAGESSPDFDSGTQLMRQFWRHKRQEIEKAGHSAGEREALLNGLVDYIERNAILSAPARLIEQWERLSSDLQSLGILQLSGQRVTFCHQSYLDFLIANRAAEAIEAGASSVAEWLGDRSMQSLFRREQLRQLLFLLAEENERRFVSVARDLIAASSVRFHIKLLTIEALGQATPSEISRSLVLELLRDPKWRDHVLRLVVDGSPYYVRFLADEGIVQAWLASDDRALAGSAVWLLGSVLHHCGGLVSKVCPPFLTWGPDTAARVASVLLRSNPDEEPKTVFAFRLKCIAAGVPPYFVAWKDLAERKPHRALRLLAALMTPEGVKRARRESRGALFGIHSPAERKAIVRAAARCPKLAWSLLQPRLLELSRLRHRETRDPIPQPQDVVNIPRMLGVVLRAAGRGLARRTPDAFLASASSMGNYPCGVVQRLLVESLVALPISHADAALSWLLDDLRRLRCRSSRYRPRWLSASRLIARMSPHCRDEVFAKIEQVLLRYRDPEERKLARLWLRDTRHGVFRNRFGEAQFVLLPALCTARRSKETTGRIGVLERKLGKRNEEFFASPRMRGGFVRSPLEPGRLDILTDVAWLGIIRNARLARRAGRLDLRDYRRDCVIESSVEMFSRDFGVAALRDPERFARLATRFPVTAPSDYHAAVVHAVCRTNPPSEVPEDRRSQWAPATPESCRKVLERVPLDADSWLAQQFCIALGSRLDIELTEPIVERLLHFAEHADPTPNALHVGCDQQASECSIDTLEQNTINCVRGVVARSLASLVFQQPDFLWRFRATIERLIDDPHPVVRGAAVHLCLAAWNSDRGLAVAWFKRAVADDERLAACHRACEFYNFAFPAFAEELMPLIRRIIASTRDDVSQVGASQVAGRWIFYDLLKDELEACCSGTRAQRKGVAATAAHLVADDKNVDRSRALIERFLDDADSEVRAETRIFLRYEKFLQLPNARQLLLQFGVQRRGVDPRERRRPLRGRSQVRRVVISERPWLLSGTRGVFMRGERHCRTERP